MDQEYRKSRIEAISKQLQSDLSKAETQLKIHKCKDASLDKAEYGLSAVTMLSGMTVLTTIASPAVGITFGVIAGVCGITDLIIKTIHKKTTIKTQKWHAMVELILDTQSQIGILISDILDDNMISDSEFRKFTEVYNTYREKLTQLRNEYYAIEKKVKLNR